MSIYSANQIPFFRLEVLVRTGLLQEVTIEYQVIRMGLKHRSTHPKLSAVAALLLCYIGDRAEGREMTQQDNNQARVQTKAEKQQQRAGE